MSSPATVLVVDDEVRSLEALRRVLQDEFEVICARSAEEAEGVLAGELVQIILCDQRMPGEAGVDFLKRARDLWPDTIRIIISGYTDSEDVIAGVNLAGIYRYVTKPWRPEELLELMREAARLSKLQHEAADVAMEAKPSGERLRGVIRERRRTEGRLYEFDRIVHRPDSPIREAIALGRQAAKYARSARSDRARSACASFPRPIAISPPKSSPAASAAISITEWRRSRSTCRRWRRAPTISR